MNDPTPPDADQPAQGQNGQAQTGQDQARQGQTGPGAPRGRIRRRALLAGLGTAGAGLLALGVGEALDAFPDHDTDADSQLANGPPKHVRLSLQTGAPPAVAITVAQTNGLFATYNLDVELIRHDRPEQATAALAAGQVDAAVLSTVKWLPALQGGLAARMVSGLHAGGVRLLVPRRSPIKRIEDMDARRVGLAHRDSATMQMLAIMMRRKGMNPLQQIQWIECDPAQFISALNEGRVDAIAGVDPLMWQLRESQHLNQIVASDQGSFRQRVSSVVGVSSAFSDAQKPVVTGLVHAFQDAASWTARHPKEAAALLAADMPGFSPDQAQAMLVSEGQDIHPIGVALREQVAQYADELKLLGVFPQTLNSAAFARQAVEDLIPA